MKAYKFYADTGSRRTRQLVADVITAGWCLLWIIVGAYVTNSFHGAENGARKLQSSGASMSHNLNDAGSTISGLPMVGGALKEPFDKAASAATSVGNAGHDLAGGLGRLAFLLGILTALTPMFLALLPWSLVRVRYARKAGRMARLRALPAGEKLLALEALTSASPKVLEALSEDPAGDWQQGDVVITHKLADMALGAYGLRRQEGRREIGGSVRRGDEGPRGGQRSERSDARRPRHPQRPWADESDGRRREFEGDDTHWA